MNNNKQKAFTLLEVLFAIVIFSVTASSIFVFMKHILKTTSRINKKTKTAETMVVIFSENNPAFFPKTADQKIEIKKYKKIPVSLASIENLERVLSESQKDELPISGGFVFITPEKDKKNEKK